MKIPILIGLLVIATALLVFSGDSGKHDKVTTEKVTNQNMSLKEALNIEFTTLDGVKKSPWYNYLTCFYTDEQITDKITDGNGKFKMNDLWELETSLIPSIYTYGEINKTPPLEGNPYLSLYSNLDIHAKDKGKIFIYHYNSVPGGSFEDKNSNWGRADPDPNFYLNSGIKSNTWVEVIHSADVKDSYKWFYYMPGSGNWLNLGRTKIFADHRNAFEEAKKGGVNFTDDIDGVSDDQTNMGDYFRSDKGGRYDTLQFTSRSEYQFKYEIMDLRKKQMVANNSCVEGILTRGKKKCNCDSSQSMLNCEVDVCGKNFI